MCLQEKLLVFSVVLQFQVGSVYFHIYQCPNLHRGNGPSPSLDCGREREMKRGEGGRSGEEGEGLQVVV